MGSRRRWNAVSFCTKDRVLKIELQKKMNAVRFCTKEEEVLKIESFRRRCSDSVPRMRFQRLSFRIL